MDVYGSITTSSSIVPTIITVSAGYLWDLGMNQAWAGGRPKYASPEVTGRLLSTENWRCLGSILILLIDWRVADVDWM